MMQKDIVKLGVGVVIGIILYKALKLVWLIVTLPIQLTLGHTDWYK
jgi:large-conductance mechanosensitive channel